MKKILACLCLALASAALVDASAAAPAVLPLPEIKPQPHQLKAAQISTALLTSRHYKPTRIDDALSVAIFDGYLAALDSEKMFFVQSDIDQWAGARTRLDDAILAADLGLPFAIYKRFLQRVGERFAHARSLLGGGFDFRSRENYAFSREKAAWAKSEAELRELWRLRVKNDWLRLKLAGKDDKSIAETLDRRYENALKRINRASSDDAFQTFMNAYTMAIEPHTAYLGSRAADDFGIRMSLSLVGIGAVLAEKDDYTTIRELVPGGPAMLSGQLKVGDRIVGVAQGEDGPMTDIVGWRVDDAVTLIRGAADSVVRLDTLPADAGPTGAHRQVTLVRKKISLDERAAKKSVLVARDGNRSQRIGVIALPTFYQDSEARSQGKPDFRSAARDVARLLGELKAEKVDGVLIDLRNNGGGSLTEAIELTGLFIDTGPVVQQRDARGRITVASDTHAGVAWEGPLGILINRSSASAAEIFAAAMQDYGRGLVVGEPSFGKGTVQTLVNLDRVNDDRQQRLGDLKLTTAQFFRIDGGTTQLRGVQPDVPIVASVDSERHGEARFLNALPWLQIKAADYAPLADLKPLRTKLRARHQERIGKDPDFQDLQADLAELGARLKNNLVSLNEAERRKERDATEARQKAREARLAAGKSARATNGRAFDDDGLQANERQLSADLAAESAQKSARDIVLDEAVSILGDLNGLLRADPAVAVRAAPARRSPAAPEVTGGASRD